MRVPFIEQSLVPLQPGMRAYSQYREALIKWNPRSFKNLALCYEFHTGDAPQPLGLIPDACLNFLFQLDGRAASAMVSGIQTAPSSIALLPNTTYLGLKPYSTKGMRQFLCGWSELCNGQCNLQDLLDCYPLLESLLQAEHFERRLALLQQFASENLADTAYSPDLVEHTEIRLCNFKGNLKVEDIAEFTGYSGRYCREKFKNATGVSIKRYSSIIRFQNVVRMLSRESSNTLSDIVFENGYFDQPHLNREFKLFSGNSPLSYREKFLIPR